MLLPLSFSLIEFSPLIGKTCFIESRDWNILPGTFFVGLVRIVVSFEPIGDAVAGGTIAFIVFPLLSEGFFFIALLILFDHIEQARDLLVDRINVADFQIESSSASIFAFVRYVER